MTGIILCALDISQKEHEEKVLRRAAQIAEIDNARLDVITVVPSYHNSMVAGYFSPDYHDRAVAETRRALSDFVEATLGAEANAGMRHVVATGTVYEEVLAVAEADGASVIVLGSHRPALRDYLIGPNASRVVRHAGCSVFVVR